MRGVGLVALLWLLISMPLGILVGAALRRRGDECKPLPHIPRQRADGVAAHPNEDRELAAPLRSAWSSGLAAVGVLVGALTFTVGTAAAVSGLPGPTPPAVAGVIEAVTPFQVGPRVEPVKPATDPQPVAKPRKKTERASAESATTRVSKSTSSGKTSGAALAASASPAPSPTATASPTPSPSGSPSPTESGSPSPTPTGSGSPTSTESPSASPSPTDSGLPSPSASPTHPSATVPVASPSPTPAPPLGAPPPAQ